MSNEKTETKPLSEQEQLVANQKDFVKQQAEFTKQQGEFATQQDEFSKLQEETAKKQDKNSSIDENGQAIKPKFKDSELSKHVPKDELFNKLHHYNSGTTKSAIGVTNQVEYFNFHYKGTKYTFWKGLPLTKSQVEEMPKGYVKRICG